MNDNPPLPAIPHAAAIPLRECCGSSHRSDETEAGLAVAVEALPGPAGETNALYVRPRGRDVRIAGTERELTVRARAATAAGSASLPSPAELHG